MLSFDNCTVTNDYGKFNEHAMEAVKALAIALTKNAEAISDLSKVFNTCENKSIGFLINNVEPKQEVSDSVNYYDQVLDEFDHD